MTINDIITLGENGSIGDKKFSKKLLYSLPINPRVRALSFVDLENLMKGLAFIENTEEGYGSFGSTTVMGKLLELLKKKNIEDKQKRVETLVNWMLNNRNNPYIPFGHNVPIQIKSIKEYALYEHQRCKHREKMEVEKQERSELAKKNKMKIVAEHKEKQEKHSDTRIEIIKKTKRLNVVNRFRMITKSDHPINIYPEEYAEISIDDLEKIPKDLLEQILLKLEHSKKGSQWSVLKKVINDYLKLDEQDNSFLPNYIICPDCGNILDTSFKDMSCPNPLCSFRFKGLNKYLNKGIDELKRELAIEFRREDDRLIKLIATALKYNSGIYLVNFINNFYNKEYRKNNETFLLLYLKDVNIVKKVLSSNVIKNDDNVYISKNGYKIFADLINSLYLSNSKEVKDFLMNEFANYHVKMFRKLMANRRDKNK